MPTAYISYVHSMLPLELYARADTDQNAAFINSSGHSHMAQLTSRTSRMSN